MNAVNTCFEFLYGSKPDEVSFDTSVYKALLATRNAGEDVIYAIHSKLETAAIQATKELLKLYPNIRGPYTYDKYGLPIKPNGLHRGIQATRTGFQVNIKGHPRQTFRTPEQALEYLYEIKGV